MLHFLDLLLTVLHLCIIFFNLFGWIPLFTRKAHLVSILITAVSWLILGLWYGIGYCPITDWHWQVKQKLGENNLPSSFIKYFADKIGGKNFDPDFINTITAICFALVAVTSIYLNLVNARRQKSRRY